MQSLKNELLLYHGSYTEITSIDLSKSRKSLDFGAGFYLTSSFEQARNYVPSTVKKNIRRRKLPKDFDVNDGRISVYRFHFNDLLRIRNFNTADLERLHFIASNRDDSLFCELGEQYQDYDIIIGKVADPFLFWYLFSKRSSTSTSSGGVLSLASWAISSGTP